MYSLGIDTGGTNTDLVLTNKETGQIFCAKTPTTTYHLIEGIFTGIDKICAMAGISPGDIGEMIYGTTIVVNMIAQKENESVALITTQGFRDVLEIGRAWRDKNIYNNFMDKPQPLIRRELRYEVPERVNFNGEVVAPLDMAELDRVLDEIGRQGVRSIAVCLLHSYRNPAHEQAIKTRIAQKLPGVYISLSSEINPQFREYERTSTTAINAFMMPNMVSHLDEFRQNLNSKLMRPHTYMMNANAGVMSFQSAIAKPVAVSDSGPIGGIIAANYLGEVMNERNLITFDLGGTSCDVSLIQNNRINFRTDSHIEGYPINIPTVDLDFIGAGGGSIAWYDRGGALKVGPMSAGAYPGPVCYRRGGENPTVTDANLVLGRIRPEIFMEDLEGVVQKTEEAIMDKIAKPLGLGLIEAAEGIIQVVNANMIRAIKLVSVQKGYDPREFTLVSFGGAGGLHAAKLAQELEIPKVIVPYSPGTFAAMGQILADIKHDFVFTRLQDAEQLDCGELNRIFAKLEQDGIRQLDAEGVGEDARLLVRSCDIRYLGQAYELNIALSNSAVTPDEVEAMLEKFHQTHEQTYGHSLRGDKIEIVNYRVSAIGTKSKIRIDSDMHWHDGDASGEIQYADVVFDGQPHRTAVYERDGLACGTAIEGPAIIGEMGSTTVVYPGQRAYINEYRAIVIETTV